MIERQIIIGLITSKEYLSRVKDGWNSQLLESSTAKRLSTWCWAHYNKYQKAPNKDIENIFYEKVEAHREFPKDQAEDIQEILEGLSNDYEQADFNLEYLLDQTSKYFRERRINLFKDQIENLVQEGELSEAEKLVKEFKPYQMVSINKLNEFIWSLKDMRKLEIEKHRLLMKPWLRAGEATFIYGDYGTGKSLLTIHIASLLALHKDDAIDYDIGEWQVKNPTGCLYIDGEMGVVELQERLGQFEYLGKQKFPILGFSLPQYQLKTEDSFPLSERENQTQIIHWLQEHPDYKLLVLDSVTTLFGLIDENNNAEWNNKINPLLRDLRAIGVAVILLHHAGKDSKRGLRGASTMGAMAHNIFSITQAYDYDAEKGEAWFELGKRKQRAGGFQFKPFEIHYTQNSNRTETDWEITAYLKKYKSTR